MKGKMIHLREGDRIPFEPDDGPYDAEAARRWLASADLVWWRKRCKVAVDLDPASETQFG
jgi:hypothetical protein